MDHYNADIHKFVEGNLRVRIMGSKSDDLNWQINVAHVARTYEAACQLCTRAFQSLYKGLQFYDPPSHLILSIFHFY